MASLFTTKQSVFRKRIVKTKHAKNINIKVKILISQKYCLVGIGYQPYNIDILEIKIIIDTKHYSKPILWSEMSAGSKDQVVVICPVYFYSQSLTSLRMKQCSCTVTVGLWLFNQGMSTYFTHPSPTSTSKEGHWSLDTKVV